MVIIKRFEILVVMLLLVFVQEANATINSTELVRRNFTEYGISIEVPSDWIVTNYEDKGEMYITENPLVDGRWDGRGFIFGAIKITEGPDCPVDVNDPEDDIIKILDYMGDTLDLNPPPSIEPVYLEPPEEVFARQMEEEGYAEITIGHHPFTCGFIHKEKCYFYFFRFFDNYRQTNNWPYETGSILESWGREETPYLAPYPNQEIYHRILNNFKKINVTEPDFYILTSFDILCPDAEYNDPYSCIMKSQVTRLKDMLVAQGHHVRIIDIDKGGETASYDAVLAEEVRKGFHNQATNIDENTTIFIFGSYSVIPPCLYPDIEETKHMVGILENESERKFISDDCYGTYEFGPSKAVISRLPTTSHWGASEYIDSMIEYHTKKADGKYGLNHKRLQEVYGKNCPDDEMNFYYFYYMFPKFHITPFAIGSGPFLLVDSDIKFAKDLEGVTYQASDQETMFEILDFLELGYERGYDLLDYHKYPLQYFLFHGVPKNDRWVSNSNVTVIANETQPYPSVATTFSCFGGHISGSSIPETWLLTPNDENHPNAVVGSTDIVATSNIVKFCNLHLGFEVFLEEYHKELESGKTIGEAVRNAKKRMFSYDYSDRDKNEICYIMYADKLRRINDKNAITFQLFGDPLLKKEDMINSDFDGCDKIE